MVHSVKIEYLEKHCSAGFSSKSERMLNSIHEARAWARIRIGEMHRKGGKFTVQLNDELIYDSSDARFNLKED